MNIKSCSPIISYKRGWTHLKTVIDFAGLKCFAIDTNANMPRTRARIVPKSVSFKKLFDVSCSQ